MEAHIWDESGQAWAVLHVEPATRGERDRALACAKGAHQRALVEGSRPWELAKLCATRQPWAETYETSREALRARLAKEFGRARLRVIKFPGEDKGKMRALLQDSAGKWIVL